MRNDVWEREQGNWSESKKEPGVKCEGPPDKWQEEANRGKGLRRSIPGGEEVVKAQRQEGAQNSQEAKEARVARTGHARRRAGWKEGTEEVAIGWTSCSRNMNSTLTVQGTPYSFLTSSSPRSYRRGKITVANTSSTRVMIKTVKRCGRLEMPFGGRPAGPVEGLVWG